MGSLTSSVTIDRPREEIFAFLDVLANHESFNDHFMVDWASGGPRSGVGATVSLRVEAPGQAIRLTMRVTESDAPARIVEESATADGRRRNRGTYVLAESPEGGTVVTFRLEQLRRPVLDRLLAPLSRLWLQRATDRALRRLDVQLRATGAERPGLS